MASDYTLTVKGSLDKKAEWLPREMKYDDICEGWTITLFNKGFTATRQVHEEPEQAEMRELEAEAREIATQLLNALTYLMNKQSSHKEPRPGGDTVSISGQRKISTTLDLGSPGVSLIVWGPPPLADEVRTFWRDLRNPPLAKAVSCYLEALDATAESHAATELHKSIEAIESFYSGEAKAYGALKYLEQRWKDLKHNLNWKWRHLEGKFDPPSQELHINECRSRVREIIETLRASLKSKS